jgi:hypothetical protein
MESFEALDLPSLEVPFAFIRKLVCNFKML